MAHPDVLVVGGGVIGCSITYFLARAGHRVTLLERDDLAAHASGAAAGMLAPICEATDDGPFFALSVRSLGMFPDLVHELRELSGVDPQFVPSGILRVAESASEAAHLEAQATRLAHFGLEWLSPEAARHREPLLAPDLHGALWSPREAHVFSPLMTLAYARAASTLGATLETGSPVVGLLRAGERVTGVRTPQGDRPAGRVILCSGAWTRFLGAELGIELPIAPVRGQILSLDGPRPPMRSIVWGEGAYLVPKLSGQVVVGATQEHAGYDCRTTAEGIGKLLHAAPRYVPALAKATFRLAWAGLRPDTPDHLPILGALPGLTGVAVAAGHFRNGVLLSPITGFLVQKLLESGSLPAEAAAFAPDRFLSPRS